MPHIRVEDLCLERCHTHDSRRDCRPLFDHINLDVARGEFVCIVGPSGCGKTTLLNIIGGLDPIQNRSGPHGEVSGRVLIEGVDTGQLRGRERSALLNRHIGFIFSDHQLIPELSALDNVALPARIAGFSQTESRRRSQQWLAQLNLVHEAHEKPTTLSSGEQQRVAIARALVNNPSIILADEPLGDLNPDMKARVMQLFIRVNRGGCTILMVTHDLALVQKTAGDGAISQIFDLGNPHA